MATDITAGAATTIIAASAVAGSTPSSDTDGFMIRPTAFSQSKSSGRVRTLIKKTGAITAARLRLYTREPGGTEWYRGASTDESGYPISAGEGNESRDWDIGEGVEFTFVLEAISPSGSTPTVAVKAVGVNR